MVIERSRLGCARDYRKKFEGKSQHDTTAFAYVIKTKIGLGADPGVTVTCDKSACSRTCGLTIITATAALFFDSKKLDEFVLDHHLID